MNDDIPEYLRPTITRIRASDISKPLFPWSLIGEYADQVYELRDGRIMQASSPELESFMA